MTILLSPVVYERGVGGVPTTTVAAQLGGRLTSYEHAIRARGGFESCRLTFGCGRDEALDWLANGPMRSVVVYDPDAQIVWEGYLEMVEATFGDEQRSVSIRPMANAVTARYTAYGGTASDLTGSDSASIATYGRKEAVISLSDQIDASPALTAYLRESKAPKMTGRMRLGSGGGRGPIEVALTFAGWYYTLSWLTTPATFDSAANTTALAMQWVATYNATNAFFATSTANVVPSGTNDSGNLSADTTILQIIEKYLGQATSANERQSWGVYEGRSWTIRPWAGAAPERATYQRYLGDGRLYNDSGAVVLPWNARPDAMYHVVDLLDPGPTASSQDAAARSFVERVSCRLGGDGVELTLDPADAQTFEAVMARFNDGFLL